MITQNKCKDCGEPLTLDEHLLGNICEPCMIKRETTNLMENEVTFPTGITDDDDNDKKLFPKHD